MTGSDDEFYGHDSDAEEVQDTTVQPQRRNSFFGHSDLQHDDLTGKYDSIARTQAPEGAPSARLPRGARLGRASRESMDLKDEKVDIMPSPPRRPIRSSFYANPSDTSTTSNSNVRPQVLDRPSSFYGSQKGRIPSTSNASISNATITRPGSFVSSTSTYELADRRSIAWTASMYSNSPSLTATESSSLPPLPLLDHSHLQVGDKASLLSHMKTLELYRANAKKSNDPEVLFGFATLMLSVAKDLQEVGEDEEGSPSSSEQYLDANHRRRRSSLNLPSKKSSPSSSSSSVFRSSQNSDPQEPISSASSETDLPVMTKRNGLLRESAGLLRKLANQGYVPAQYLLADLHTQGTLSSKGSPEFDKAFPLFVLAAKHGHTDAAFRTAQCCEYALGCRRDYAKAFQWYKCVFTLFLQ